MDCRNRIPVIATLSLLVAVVLLASAPPSGADPEGGGIPTDTYHKFTVTFRIEGVGMCDHFTLSMGDGYVVDSSVDDTDWIRVVYDSVSGSRTYIATYTYAPVPGTYDVEFSAYDSGGEHSSVEMRVVLLGYPTVSFAGECTGDFEDIVVVNGADNGCPGYDEYYARASEPASPVREGYIFSGWFTDEGCTEPYDWNALVRDDITLYAGWEKDPSYVRIVFKGADGTVYSDTGYVVGDVITAPVDPVFPPTSTEVYTFGGWSGFTEGMVAERDSEFVAVVDVSERLYTVTYYVEGKPFVTQKYPYGAEVAYPAEVPEVDGYVFKGWKNHSADMVVTGDRGFCAVLEQGNNTVFEVSYVVDGVVKKTFVPVGASVSLDVPTKAGYTFSGWFADRECTIPVDVSSITDDSVVYAGFEKIQSGNDSTNEGSFDIMLIIGAAVIVLGFVSTLVGGRKNTVFTIGGVVAVVAGGCMMSVSGGFL